MNENPIRCNNDMVRAILDGRKTQARRVIEPQPACDMPGAYFDAYNGGPQWNWWLPDNRLCNGHDIIRCPYGRPGDRLWVQETHSWITLAENEATAMCTDCRRHPDGYPVHMLYRADFGEHDDQPMEWSPFADMPRWASRTNLEVTGVRVQRVQDIGRDDALAEGIAQPEDGIPVTDAVTWFQVLWDSINARRGYGWDVNPFVWVIEFRVIK